jgi:hypothetical protein
MPNMIFGGPRYLNKEKTQYVGNQAPEKSGWSITGYKNYTSGGGPRQGQAASMYKIPTWERMQATAAAAPAAPAPSPPPDTTPASPVVDQGIIDMTPGTNSNVNGNALGIRIKRSKAREAGLTGMGTNRLTIPRSSGASSLNIG